MQCPMCDAPKRDLYCAPCLRQGVADHTLEKARVQAQADSAVERAEALLTGPIPGSQHGVTSWRELRASVAMAEDRCATLREEIASRTAEIERARNATAHSDAGRRREVLEAAQRARLTPADIRAQIAVVRSKQHEVGKRIIQARRLLYREALDVFGVQRGRKGWEIAGLELPAPEAFRLHSSSSINGAFMHTIHLLNLVTFYLSIAIPFEPTPPQPLRLPHVGRPLIKDNPPFLYTTKWRDKHVLWMSSTASMGSKLKRVSAASSDGKASKTEMAALRTALAKSWKKHRATLTAFALLAHSIAYFAYSQGVLAISVPSGGNKRDSEDDDAPPPPLGLGASAGNLVPATAVLELLSLVAESPQLGIRAHAPGTTDRMRHMGFGIDVHKVVAAVIDAEEAKWGPKPAGEGEDLSEGWDLMEDG